MSGHIGQRLVETGERRIESLAVRSEALLASGKGGSDFYARPPLLGITPADTAIIAQTDCSRPNA